MLRKILVMAAIILLCSSPAMSDEYMQPARAGLYFRIDALMGKMGLLQPNEVDELAGDIELHLGLSPGDTARKLIYLADRASFQRYQRQIADGVHHPGF